MKEEMYVELAIVVEHEWNMGTVPTVPITFAIAGIHSNTLQYDFTTVIL